MLKTNVVKKHYYLLTECKGGCETVCGVDAESLDSAILRLPYDYKFIREVDRSYLKDGVIFIPIK